MTQSGPSLEKLVKTSSGRNSRPPSIFQDKSMCMRWPPDLEHDPLPTSCPTGLASCARMQDEALITQNEAQDPFALKSRAPTECVCLLDLEGLFILLQK